MTFSERLKQLRTERKLTQEMLSKESGLTKSSIAMYETGKRKPKIEVLERLADFFNVDLDYLVGKSDRTTVIAPPAPQKSGQKNRRRGFLPAAFCNLFCNLLATYCNLLQPT